MMDIVKLLREAGDVYHDIARDMLQNEWKEHLAPHYTKRGNELKLAAAELEGDAEPDYWGAVTEDGHIELGMREPTTDDDGAKWCARTEVNQHINDRMLEHPGLRLHLEPLYRRRPTERAVPEGYVMLPAKLTAENGAKSALMGEFHERIETECPECEGGLHDNDDGCAECGGEWVVYDKMPVSWDTIKRIHEAVVQHFAAAPGAGGES